MGRLSIWALSHYAFGPIPWAARKAWLMSGVGVALVSCGQEWDGRGRPHEWSAAGLRWDAAQSPEPNAASKAVDGGSMAASPRTYARASGAPVRRSMPASSHSIEIGPS